MRQFSVQIPRLRRSKERRRRWPIGTIARAGAGTAAGAGLMFLLDPQAGRRRRAQTRDRSLAAMRRFGRRLERASRRARADGYGAWRRARHLLAKPEPVANDQMLTDRVLSQVFRGLDLSPRRVNVDVVDGVAVLRGELDRPDEIRRLEEAVRHVPGVRDVESYLHLPHTVAPNKQEVAHPEPVAGD